MAYGQTIPYLSLREILRTNFRIEEGDNALQMQEKLRQGVLRTGTPDRLLTTLNR
jgi:hypothetical protein